MLGRIRRSSSSMDCLERPPTKIIKDDRLSIYEATLLKLKLGSRRPLSSPSDDKIMEIETECTPASLSMGSSHHSSREHEQLHASDSATASSPFDQKVIMDTYSSSQSVSSKSSDSDSMSRLKQKPEEDCASS